MMKLSCANGLISRLRKYFDKKGCENCKITAGPLRPEPEIKTPTPLTYEELKLQLEEAENKIILQKSEIDYLNEKIDKIKQVKADFDFKFDDVL